MKHRHLDYAPHTSVESLPSAALVDLLDRGDLGEWQPILASVARDPEGELADRLMRLVDRFPMYGTSTLIRTWIDRVRASARAGGPSADETTLRDLRRRAGLTQTHLADRMGMSQSDLSKLERRRDVRISTLRSYLQALGGRLVLLAVLRGRVARIALASKSARRVRRRA